MLDLPVFIGGFRSGTTLLINLLGLHPHITPWFETRELCEALRWQHVLQHPDQTGFEAAYCAPAELPGFTLDAVHARMLHQVRDTHARMAGERARGKAAHERYPLGNDYLCYAQAEAEAALTAWRQAGGSAVATGALINRLGARQQTLHGGGPWVNKTPEITRFARELRAALGPCRMIYVVRDGIQVVASGHRLGWGSIETLAFNWKGLLERTRAAMQEHSGDYLELRYEALVLEPAKVLDRVLGFCGREAQGTDLVRRFIERQGDGALDPTRMQGRAALDPGQLRTFAAVAGDMQAALGYPAPPSSGT